MTPEQVERLKRVAEAFAEQTPDLAADIRALLAEWEERGREIAALRDEVARLRHEVERRKEEVEELEAHWKDFMQWDESAVMYDWKKRAEAAEKRVEELERQARLREIDCANETLRAEAAEAKLAKVVEALREIEEGAGPFDRDPLKHASNCVEAMRATARAALAAAKGE